MRLQDASAAYAYGDRVSTGLARVGLPSRMVPIACIRVMVRISGCYIIVIVSRRSVVVIRVIVPRVLVDVQRRGHGRRRNHGLNKHESDEPAHGGQSTTKEKTGGQMRYRRPASAPLIESSALAAVCQERREAPSIPFSAGSWTIAVM